MIDVWHTLESAFEKIIGNLRTAEKEVPDHPIQAIGGWSYLMDFLLFENQAITGEIVCHNLQRRAYTSPKDLNRHYRNLVEHGYVTEDDGLFTITPAGRSAYLDYFAQKASSYSRVILLTEDDFNHFINFLKKGYEAGKVAEQLQHKPSMLLGEEFYTNIGGGQLGTMLGWINLFELYRDDVHAAVWKEADFTGIQIEAFTQIWRDVAHTLQELSEDLAFRGYKAQDYQVVLDELLSRDLLAIDNDFYALTAKGIALREKIEADTAQIFHAFCADTYSEQDLVDFERIIGIIKKS